jgi:hypothetical protein
MLEQIRQIRAKSFGSAEIQDHSIALETRGNSSINNASGMQEKKVGMKTKR